MSKLSNYLDIALGVVREGASDFTKNISKYNQLEGNIGREVKICADRELNKLMVDSINSRSSFNVISEELDENLMPIKHYYLGDQEKISAKIKSVANQGKAR